MIDNRFAYFNTNAQYEAKKQEIADQTIVFIADKKIIKTHGKTFSLTEDEVNELISAYTYSLSEINSKIDEVLNKYKVFDDSTSGLVPAPNASGRTGLFLNNEGNWVNPISSLSLDVNNIKSDVDALIQVIGNMSGIPAITVDLLDTIPLEHLEIPIYKVVYDNYGQAEIAGILFVTGTIHLSEGAPLALQTQLFQTLITAFPEKIFPDESLVPTGKYPAERYHRFYKGSRYSRWSAVPEVATDNDVLQTLPLDLRTGIYQSDTDGVYVINLPKRNNYRVLVIFDGDIILKIGDLNTNEWVSRSRTIAVPSGKTNVIPYIDVTGTLRWVSPNDLSDIL